MSSNPCDHHGIDTSGTVVETQLIGLGQLARFGDGHAEDCSIMPAQVVHHARYRICAIMPAEFLAHPPINDSTIRLVRRLSAAHSPKDYRFFPMILCFVARIRARCHVEICKSRILYADQTAVLAFCKSRQGLTQGWMRP